MQSGSCDFTVHQSNGSKMQDDWVDSAAALPCQTLNGERPGVASIFTATMYTIKTTMEELSKQ